MLPKLEENSYVERMSDKKMWSSVERMKSTLWDTTGRELSSLETHFLLKPPIGQNQLEAREQGSPLIQSFWVSAWP